MNGSPEVLWERRTRRDCSGQYRGEYAAPTKAGLQP